MSNLPNCPKCDSEYTYEDGALYVCPECAHEWGKDSDQQDNDTQVIKDSNGNILNDGDTVSVIKDLKVKGSSSVIKVGTKVKNIRLVEGDHDIDEEVGYHRLRERALEGLHQTVGKPPDEPNRVGEQHFLTSIQLQAPGCRIQGCE